MKKLLIVYLVLIASFLPQPPPKPSEISIQIPHISKLSTVSAEPVSALSEAQEVIVTPAPVAPVSAAPVSSGCQTGVTTGNYYEDFIIAHESGGNSCAINPSSGSCNLFQEYPCGKSGCSTSDVACELAWGNGYALQRYGGWEQAYAYWVKNHNW